MGERKLLLLPLKKGRKAGRQESRLLPLKLQERDTSEDYFAVARAALEQQQQPRARTAECGSEERLAGRQAQSVCARSLLLSPFTIEGNGLNGRSCLTEVALSPKKKKKWMMIMVMLVTLSLSPW